MALASISLRGLRNLEPTTIEFDRGANYLFGPNGAGKTNLLEAIHYLAIGRSFRRCPDAELLGFGQDVLVVSGTDENGERGEIRFDGREKRILRNDIPVEKLSEYFGWLPVVVLLLEDIELVRGALGIRRSFLDVAIAKAGPSRKGSDHKDTKTQSESRPRCQTGAAEANSEGRSLSAEGRMPGADSHHQDTKTQIGGQPEVEVRRQRAEGRSCSSPQPSPHRGEGERGEGEEAVGGQRLAVSGQDRERSYITLMTEYRRAVSQYNRLLERATRDQGRGTRDEIAAWEEEVVRAGVPVYEARLASLGELLDGAARHYERLAGHAAVFSYRSSVVTQATTEDSDTGRSGKWGSVPDYAGAFRQRLAATRERALTLGRALVGPHRDDIRITRDDRELRRFGSVGEQRLAGIALRLAEADMILSAGRQRPVFLLDEVASELDEQRSRMVLAMVAERGQMVYAAARRTVRRQVRAVRQGPPRPSSKDEGRIEESVRDAEPSLDHLTTGSLDHFSGKEFHVEAGKVSEVP